jgi:two-component system, OmpR family, response regulator
MDWTKGRDATPFDRAIDVALSRLRRKLRDDPQAPKFIRTVRSGGYLFAARVERG